MLAGNFERAAELVDVPQDFIMQVYELLRPGRAKDKAPLLERRAKVARRLQGGADGRASWRKPPKSTSAADCSPIGSRRWAHRRFSGLPQASACSPGWRLYACVLATGIAMRLGIVDLPQHLAALDVLANPWVMGVAGLGCVAELLADKIAWLDSVWDAIHTLVRPVGGALSRSPSSIRRTRPGRSWCSCSAAARRCSRHGAKAGTRAAVNTSPEPFSNIAVSTIEDVVTTGGLWLILAYPGVAAVAAICLLALAVTLLLLVWKLWRRIRPRRDANGSSA